MAPAKWKGKVGVSREQYDHQRHINTEARHGKATKHVSMGLKHMKKKERHVTMKEEQETQKRSTADGDIVEEEQWVNDEEYGGSDNRNAKEREAPITSPG